MLRVPLPTDPHKRIPVGILNVLMPEYIADLTCGRMRRSDRDKKVVQTALGAMYKTQNPDSESPKGNWLFSQFSDTALHNLDKSLTQVEKVQYVGNYVLSGLNPLQLTWTAHSDATERFHRGVQNEIKRRRDIQEGRAIRKFAVMFARDIINNDEARASIDKIARTHDDEKVRNFIRETFLSTNLDEKIYDSLPEEMRRCITSPHISTPDKKKFMEDAQKEMSLFLGMKNETGQTLSPQQRAKKLQEIENFDRTAKLMTHCCYILVAQELNAPEEAKTLAINFNAMTAIVTTIASYSIEELANPYSLATKLVNILLNYALDLSNSDQATSLDDIKNYIQAMYKDMIKEFGEIKDQLLSIEQKLVDVINEIKSFKEDVIVRLEDIQLSLKLARDEYREQTIAGAGLKLNRSIEMIDLFPPDNTEFGKQLIKIYFFAVGDAKSPIFSGSTNKNLARSEFLKEVAAARRLDRIFNLLSYIAKRGNKRVCSDLANPLEWLKGVYAYLYGRLRSINNTSNAPTVLGKLKGFCDFLWEKLTFVRDTTSTQYNNQLKSLHTEGRQILEAAKIVGSKPLIESLRQQYEKTAQEIVTIIKNRFVLLREDVQFIPNLSEDAFFAGLPLPSYESTGKSKLDDASCNADEFLILENGRTIPHVFKVKKAFDLIAQAEKMKIINVTNKVLYNDMGYKKIYTSDIEFIKPPLNGFRITDIKMHQYSNGRIAYEVPALCSGALPNYCQSFLNSYDATLKSTPSFVNHSGNFQEDSSKPEDSSHFYSFMDFLNHQIYNHIRYERKRILKAKILELQSSIKPWIEELNLISCMLEIAIKLNRLQRAGIYFEDLDPETHFSISSVYANDPIKLLEEILNGDHRREERDLAKTTLPNSPIPLKKENGFDWKRYIESDLSAFYKKIGEHIDNSTESLTPDDGLAFIQEGLTAIETFAQMQGIELIDTHDLVTSSIDRRADHISNNNDDPDEPDVQVQIPPLAPEDVRAEVIARTPTPPPTKTIAWDQPSTERVAQVRSIIQHPKSVEYPYIAGISSGASRIMMGFSDGNIKVLDKNTLQTVGDMNHFHRRGNPFRPIVNISEDLFVVAGENTLLLYDAKTGQEVFKLSINLSRPTHLEYLPDRKLLMLGNDQNELAIYAYTGQLELIEERKLQAKLVSFIAKTGDIITASDTHGSIYRMDINGNLLNTFENSGRRPAYSAEILPNNSLVTGHDTGELLQWDLETGKLLRTVQQSSGSMTPIHKLHLLDDKHVLVFHTQIVVRIYDIENWHLIKEHGVGQPFGSHHLSGHYDPDGYFFTSGYNGCLKALQFPLKKD